MDIVAGRGEIAVVYCFTKSLHAGLSGGLQILVHNPTPHHLLEEGSYKKRSLSCFFLKWECSERLRQGEFPPAWQGFISRKQLGMFKEGRLLQPVDGESPMRSCRDVGCTELHPSVMAK